MSDFESYGPLGEASGGIAALFRHAIGILVNARPLTRDFRQVAKLSRMLQTTDTFPIFTQRRLSSAESQRLTFPTLEFESR